MVIWTLLIIYIFFENTKTMRRILIMAAAMLLLSNVHGEESSILAASTGVTQETNDINCPLDDWSWTDDCLINGAFKSMCTCNKGAYTTIAYDYPEFRIKFTQ